MNKKRGIFAIIVCVFLFTWIYIELADFTPPSDKNKIFLERITQLEYKIDSLKNQKDSIRSVIDSTHVKIITNEKYYKEIVNTIISQPTSSDYEFITNYIHIRQSTNQRDSLDLFGTSKAEY